jgi:signal transduction histidine kinase
MKLKELLDQMNGQKDVEERERRALGERLHDSVSRK